MTDFVVDVKDLTRRFGDFVAVDRVSFQIARGSIFGFLGPNGAGKSTTIRMLLGILPVSDGSGTVLGKDIRTQTVEIRSQVGYMAQKFSLYEDLTVWENLEFFAGIFQVTERGRLEQLLELLRLEEYRKTLAASLPGGIRQRLAFAVALVHDPEIVFLDEPTGAVDPALRRYFWEIIVDLAQRGKTVMVTTHYMDEVERCDNICFIYGGRVIAQGSPSELKRDHVRGRIYQFEPRNRLEALDQLARMPEVHNPFPSGLSVRFQSEGELEELRGRTQSDLKIVRPTLEDVFISLVAKS